MDLITPVTDEQRFHPNFKSILARKREHERITINNWAKDFPDRDNKFVREFQETFNSSYWELYLYQLFKKFGMKFNWDFPAPDFNLISQDKSFTVEAVTANKGEDENVHEWEKDITDFKAQEYYLKNLNEMNKYSMIRISNAIISKYRKYIKDNGYGSKRHVEGKPFVIALAPFEQPYFYYQYDRAITSVLYNYYVDEEAYLKNPTKYPDGSPGVELDYIEKDNGSEIPLGFFNNDEMKEVSAVIFSPIATLAKTKLDYKNELYFSSNNWLYKDNSIKLMQQDEEILEDGLFIFHNPYAKYPLNAEIFNKNRVCQVFMNKDTMFISKEFGDKHLMHRAMNLHLTTKD